MHAQDHTTNDCLTSYIVFHSPYHCLYIYGLAKLLVSDTFCFVRAETVCVLHSEPGTVYINLLVKLLSLSFTCSCF